MKENAAKNVNGLFKSYKIRYKAIMSKMVMISNSMLYILYPISL